jgi:Ca-activated chloride channel homolog
MIGKRRSFAFFLVVVLSGLAGIAAAQTVRPDLVFVAASVTGPKKAPALGLKAEDFQLFEDGAEQKILAFSAADGSWDIDLILAHSELTPGRADRTSAAIRDAVDTFQKSGNPGNKIKFDELKIGGTDGLYRAIDRNLVDLQTTTNPRRALVVITDGFSTTSGFTGTNAGGSAGGDAANALVEYSKKLNIPIYFLYTYSAPSSTSTPSGQSSRATLTTIAVGEKDTLIKVAEQTGGDFYNVDAVNQLESQCKLLAEELRNQYVIAFKSTNDKKDDKWRKLKLTLKAPSESKLAVSVKARYFVAKPTK